MDIAVRVQDLCKTYTRRRRGSGLWGGLRAYFSLGTESVHAVRHVSFNIRRGECVGLIGENGAGKSTTVKMLTGILFPTSGSAEALGLDPFRERRRLAMNIGVVFGQKPQLLWDIPAGESFKLLKGMYRIPEMTYRYTYGEAVERLELAELLKTPVRLLSLGQRMRCDLAAALLHAPALAFLDEPTIGLDVLAKERAREFIREMRRRFGTTVLLTTHDLKDIEASADRLIVLDRGQVIHDGDISGFRQAFGDGRIVVADLESDLSPGMLAELTRECERLGVRVTVESSRRLRIDCSSGGTAVDVTRALLERFRVRDLTLQTSDIETVVAKLYRGDGARQ